MHPNCCCSTVPTRPHPAIACLGPREGYIDAGTLVKAERIPIPDNALVMMPAPEMVLLEHMLREPHPCFDVWVADRPIDRWIEIVPRVPVVTSLAGTDVAVDDER